MEAFIEWCRNAVECFRALQGSDEERSEESKGGSSWYNGSDLNDAGVVEDKVRVNSTVVDNELGGTDVTVFTSWKKEW